MSIENTLSRELDLERQFQHIATSPTLESLLALGVRWQAFANKYKNLEKSHPTPALLCDAQAQIELFIEVEKFEGDYARGAEVWVLRKIWEAKRRAGHIIRPEVLNAVEIAELSRQQQRLLFEALGRCAKTKRPAKFFTRFEENLTVLLRAVGMRELAQTLEGSNHG